jgi:Zn-dependent peptidase ImmA (M78 family)
MQHARISKSDEERDAFQYAGALLLPEAAMRREIITPVTLSSIASLKPRWMVSIQAIVRRAKDLSIINDSQYSYLNAQVSAKGWKKKEPGEFEPEKPRLLKQILEDVKGVSTEQLANELRMSPAFIRDVLERYADKSKQNGNDLIRTGQKITLLKRR